MYTRKDNNTKAAEIAMSKVLMMMFKYSYHRKIVFDDLMISVNGVDVALMCKIDIKYHVTS